MVPIEVYRMVYYEEHKEHLKNLQKKYRSFDKEARRLRKIDQSIFAEKLRKPMGRPRKEKIVCVKDCCPTCGRK